jgi:hypothetical protein
MEDRYSLLGDGEGDDETDDWMGPGRTAGRGWPRRLRLEVEVEEGQGAGGRTAEGGSLEVTLNVQR